MEQYQNISKFGYYSLITATIFMYFFYNIFLKWYICDIVKKGRHSMWYREGYLEAVWDCTYLKILCSRYYRSCRSYSCDKFFGKDMPQLSPYFLQPSTICQLFYLKCFCDKCNPRAIIAWVVFDCLHYFDAVYVLGICHLLVLLFFFYLFLTRVHIT